MSLLSSTDVRSLLPELLLTGGGTAILLFDAAFPRLRRLWLPLAAAVCGAAALALLATGEAVSRTFGGTLEQTPVTVFLGLVMLLAGALAALASQGYLRREALSAGEYAALLLWSLVGLTLLVRTTELLTLFVALELLSICFYALAAYHGRFAPSAEAGLKYFLMGAFVSAFVLLGIALLYGASGTTRLEDLAAGLAARGASPTLVVLAFLLLIAGFGFKMSAAPFHAWAPDTYQGAPSPFVAFLSVAPKAASAYVLFRLLQVAARGPMAEQGPTLIAILAVLSMVLGNAMALAQKDIKRMLAYSGVAHMGYLLIPLVSVGVDALTPILVYLLAYTLMNGGAFALVGMLYAAPGKPHLISDLAGRGYRFPVLAGCLAVCMLSLGGIPPAFGFVGKVLVFAHAIEHGNLALALVGIATSLVGIVYYLRVVYVLYMEAETAAPEGLLLDGWGRAAAVAAAGATLVLGVWPAGVLDWITQALVR